MWWLGGAVRWSADAGVRLGAEVADGVVRVEDVQAVVNAQGELDVTSRQCTTARAPAHAAPRTPGRGYTITSASPQPPLQPRLSLTSPPHLHALAADAGVHPAHLTRAFRRRFGRSIGSYLRLVRLEWAAHRLATSEDLLADVAGVAGFADQSHFTRLFRQHFGCTPARYRARMRAGGAGRAT